MAWNEVLEAHLYLVRKLYPHKLAELSNKSGFEITPHGNSAKSAEDAKRYLNAMMEVMGRVPAMSAKMKITNKARELGLSMA